MKIPRILRKKLSEEDLEIKHIKNDANVKRILREMKDSPQERYRFYMEGMAMMLNFQKEKIPLNKLEFVVQEWTRRADELDQE